MRLLRRYAALGLLIIGAFVGAFSIAVAFGWGHQTLSVVATSIALAGYAGTVAGYFLLRDSDWEPVVSAWVKAVLILGSGLLIPGITALIIKLEYFPLGYFLATGSSSILVYFWFRTHATK
jgi:hypothetical protein